MELDNLVVTGLKLLLVLFLVLLNGFFVAAEFAIVKIRDTQLSPLINQGHRRAKMARRLVHNLDASLSATQLGITIASLGLGWVGEPVFFAIVTPILNWLQIQSVELQHTIAFIIGFSTITFLHIVMGELAPKSLAIQKPLPTSLWISHPMWWFYRLSYPAVWLLNGASLWMLRRLGVEPVSEAELVHSEEEVRLLIMAAQKQWGFSAMGREIMLNAIDLRKRIARDVMRPRQELVCLDTKASYAQCMEIVDKTRFSRYPISEDGDPDRTLGVVHIKDIIAMRYRARTCADLLPLARKIVYIPETAQLERVLQRFLQRKLQLAVVVDEYGGTVGVLTLENILEELVGQIQDEFDEEKPLAVRKDETTWELDGALPVHELCELVGEPLAHEGVSTTSGWLAQRLGQFPKEGDVVAVGHSELRVLGIDESRITRLELRRIRREASVT